MVFITAMKACNCSAIVVKREFSCSGKESSPEAVLSGCSFLPAESMTQIELFVTKDVTTI